MVTGSLALVAEQDFAGRQALGQRGDQEDAYAFAAIPGPPSPPNAATGLLLLLADGMGGHAAGTCASEAAVRAGAAAFRRGGEAMIERFHETVDASNDALASAIEADPERLEGMGTTLLIVVVTPAGLEWASVGDSPLYLFRRGRLRRLNADHSFRPVLREMVSRGELTEAQAAKSSLRNRLRAALVGGEIALLDLSPAPLPLVEGDLVLAASDGLQTLSDEAIAATLAPCAAAPAAEIAAALLRAVLAAGAPKQDNITVAIVRPTADWLLAPFVLSPRRTAVPSEKSDTTRIRPSPSAP